MTLESFSAWATWAADAWDRSEHYELSILAPDGTFLGSVGLGVDAASKSANLQYWVRTTGTGRGVASQAARVVSRWALQELGLQRVEIFISEHNVPSQMAARKSGARFEGVLRNKIRRDERAYDAHIFSSSRATSSESAPAAVRAACPRDGVRRVRIVEKAWFSEREDGNGFDSGTAVARARPRVRAHCALRLRRGARVPRG